MKQYLDQFKKLTITAHLSLFVAALLLVTIGITINNARTKQEVRTRAATIIGKWNVYEITLITTNTYANPYVDVWLKATFTGPTKTISIDGFWNGGQNWKIRMAPTEVGTWTYITSSNDTQLNGKTGTFTVVESDNKGFVKVNPAYPYTYMYDDGTPFFWMGDTQWFFPLTMSNLRFDDGAFQNYVDIRASQKFNHMHGVIWYPTDTVGNEGGVSFINNDKNKINPVFFQWFDKKIAYMDSKGITPGILLGWADNDVFTLFTRDQLVNFQKYLIARYAAYNVVWELIGEFEEKSSVDQSQLSTAEACARILPLGQAIETYDPYKHLTSVHPQSTSSICATSTWMDYVMQQSKNLNKITSDRVYGKPVNNEEFIYDDNTNADIVRKEAWEIVLRGGYFTYGHTKTFLETDPAFIDSDGVKYMTHLYNFFQTIEFWKLSPKNSLVTSGYALANQGKEYVVYLPSGGSTTVDLSSTGGTSSVKWYNPRTGTYQGQTTVEGGALRSFTAPDTNDWVLHIKISNPSSPSPTPTSISTPPYVTPTIYCLGSCPTLPPTNTPTQTVMPTTTPISTTPGQPIGTIPTTPLSQTPTTSPAPTIIPCSTLTPDRTNTAAANKRKIQERRGSRGISGMFQQLLQFLIQLINQLLKLLGIGGIPALPIQPVNPTPVIEPTQSTIPVPSAQPSQPVTPQPSPTLPPCEPSPTHNPQPTNLPNVTPTPLPTVTSNACAGAPEEYVAVCEQKNAWLDQKLVEWKPVEYKAMDFGVYHVYASDDMFVKTNSDIDAKMLDTILEVNTDTVVLYIRPGSYFSQKARYNELINKIRNHGKKLFIGARFDDIKMSFSDYDKALNDYTKNIIALIKPDYYGIVIEPETMGRKYNFEASNEDWKGLVGRIAGLSKQLSPNTKTAVAGHKEELNFLRTASDIKDLDIIGFDIYGMEGISPEYAGNLGKGDVVGDAIDYANSKGKETWMLETWTLAMNNSQQIAISIKDFMKPIDAKWIQLMTYYAQKHNMSAIVPFYTGKFVYYGSDQNELVSALNNKQRTPVFYAYKSVIEEVRNASNPQENP